jgi:hypothetical protein
VAESREGKDCPPWSFLRVISRSLSCCAVSMMHQQAAASHYSSAQGGSQHYQSQSSIAMMGQGGQGSSLMGQRPMAPYRPSQQGKAQGSAQAGSRPQTPVCCKGPALRFLHAELGS